MTVQGTGVTILTALMRRDRLSDLDTSWLLFGPTEEVVETRDEAPPPEQVLKFAAE